MIVTLLHVKSLVLALHLWFLIKAVLFIAACVYVCVRTCTQGHLHKPAPPACPELITGKTESTVLQQTPQLGHGDGWSPCHTHINVHSERPERTCTKLLTGLNSGKRVLQTHFLCYAQLYILIFPLNECVGFIRKKIYFLKLS